MTDKEYLIAVGLKVRAMRKQSGISQVKLAELIRMDRKLVYRLEGAKKSPTITTLKKIADALNISVQSLLP